LLTDQHGRPVAFALTPGSVHDLVGAATMLERTPTPARPIADRAHDARKLRDWLVERGCEPVIPPNPTRKHPHAYDRHASKARNIIERVFCRLKDFRRVATRYDCANDTHDVAQRLSYSSWRRHQTPVSLRPLGARSSHWYMPQRPSSPRA
jgi:transposase